MGRAGTGITQRESDALLESFAPLVTEKPATSVPRKAVETYVWLKPERVAEVAFASWTSGGLLRQASFLGLRDDKSAREVIVEMPQSKPRAKAKTDAVPLTSPDKEMYEGVTKKDVMDYYVRIAPRMLPYVKGRLVSLVRCPDGATGDCFYQRHMDDPISSMAQVPMPSVSLLSPTVTDTIPFSSITVVTATSPPSPFPAVS